MLAEKFCVSAYPRQYSCVFKACLYVHTAYNNAELTLRHLEIIMDATIGLVLVIGFPTCLVIALWAFGKLSVRPD